MSIIIKCPTTESNELELARDAYQLGYKAGTKEQSERIAELEAEVVKYPMQPMIDYRFEMNPIIDHMLNYFDLNKIAVWCQENDIDNKYQEQLAQLIGYSLGGYGDLSYVSDESYYRAQALKGADNGN